MTRPIRVKLKRYIAELTELMNENGNLTVYRSGFAGYGCPAPLPSLRFATRDGEIYHRTAPEGKKSKKIVVVDRDCD